MKSKGDLSRNMPSASVKIPFRAVYNNSAVNTTSFTSVETSFTVANLGSRVVDAGDMFTQFRLCELYVESTMINSVATPVGLPSAVHGIAFTSADPVSFVKPAALSEVVDLPSFNYGIMNQKIKLKVPKNLLYPDTPTKWYSTSTNGQFVSCGTLQHFILNGVASANVSNATIVVVSGMLEFCGTVDPNDVPLNLLELKLKTTQQEIEKRKLDHPEELFDEIKENKEKTKSENKSVSSKGRFFL